jgi:hypothetical protein
MNKSNVFFTLIISIIIQALTGLIELIGLLVKIPSKYILIQQLLALELFVQIIEGSFYLWLYFNFNNVKNITPKRYFDWAITTPTMLIQLILYLIYLHYRENNIDDNIEFFDLFNKNWTPIMTVLVLNWSMLLLGYLGEINVIPIVLGVVLGFIPFLIYYYIIYSKYAVLSNNGYKIYFYFLFFWSLYGVVAVLPYNIKNTLYNILDLFSKNFVGLYLAYIIFTQKF